VAAAQAFVSPSFCAGWLWAVSHAHLHSLKRYPFLGMLATFTTRDCHAEPAKAIRPSIRIETWPRFRNEIRLALSLNLDAGFMCGRAARTARPRNEGWARNGGLFFIVAHKAIPSVYVPVEEEMRSVASCATGCNQEEELPFELGDARNHLTIDFMRSSRIQQIERSRAAWTLNESDERVLVVRCRVGNHAVDQVGRYGHHSLDRRGAQ
jgi:hypothetical protein